MSAGMGKYRRVQIQSIHKVALTCGESMPYIYISAETGQQAKVTARGKPLRGSRLPEVIIRY